MTRVLITGGLGFMGWNFVSFLLQNNRATQLRIVDNLSYAANTQLLDSLPTGVEFYESDIRDFETMIRVSKGCDVIFNFAAETHNDSSISRPNDFVSTNVLGVASLLSAARANDVHFHQVSTDEVYGDLPLDSKELFTELSPLRPSSPYSASKASAELLVQAWVRTFGVRASISNSSNNFGPLQHPEKFIPRMISLLQAGNRPQLYGHGLNERDWLYVDDHSSGVWEIYKSSVLGEKFNISASQVRSNHQIVQLLNQSFGAPPDFVEYIEDRPGHDQKYALSSQKLRQVTKWVPSGPSIEDWISNLRRPSN